MIGCQARRPDDQVLAVYGQMGKAVQRGDAKAFVGASLGQTVHLDLVLAPASASEQVTVNAQPSSLDPSQSSVVSSVDQERI